MDVTPIGQTHNVSAGAHSRTPTHTHTHEKSYHTNKRDPSKGTPENAPTGVVFDWMKPKIPFHRSVNLISTERTKIRSIHRNHRRDTSLVHLRNGYFIFRRSLRNVSPSYHREYMRSLPNSPIKHGLGRSIPRSGTSQEIRRRQLGGLFFLKDRECVQGSMLPLNHQRHDEKHVPDRAMFGKGGAGTEGQTPEEGLEPSTTRLKVSRSTKLSYPGMSQDGSRRSCGSRSRESR